MKKRKRHTPEQIIRKLRDADTMLVTRWRLPLKQPAARRLLSRTLDRRKTEYRDDRN